MSNVILQVPEVTAIRLGIGTPHFVALIFSVTTNVLPGCVFLLCAAALPAIERRFVVFPAFTYFAGTLAAQFFSVAEGLVATAYVWLLLYLILFGRLSGWRLGLILLLSVGSLHLHEEMSFLGPVLIAAGCLRWRDAKPHSARLVLGLALLAIVASSAVGAYWVLFPASPSEAAYFVYQVRHLQWLYLRGTGCNLPAALGLLAGIGIMACIAAPRFSRVAVIVFGIIAAILAVAAFWADALTAPEAQFFARGNAAFLSFPLMILVLVARFVPAVCHRLTAPAVQAIVMIVGLSVSLWHVQATEKWSAYLSHVRTILVSSSGIIPQTALLQPPGTRPAQLSAMMRWSWTYPDLSILALSRRCISSLIANPPGGGPYDLQNPATLPRIPIITYTYLLPPDHQPAACSPNQP